MTVSAIVVVMPARNPLDHAFKPTGVRSVVCHVSYRTPRRALVLSFFRAPVTIRPEPSSHLRELGLLLPQHLTLLFPSGVSNMKSLLTNVVFLALTAMIASGAPAPKEVKETKEELTKKELAKLEGTWKFVSYVNNGEEASGDAVSELATVTFKGTKFSFSTGETGEITSIDPTTSPKTIEYKLEGVPKELEIQRGIYMIDGDEFKDCVSLGDDERPKEFAAKEGSGHILAKFKRVKE
jgi:uncharacterized protein (TIGR03067 family)